MPSLLQPFCSVPAHQTKSADFRAPITIADAVNADRTEIYALRHRVYALELGQHAADSSQQLSDALDAYNFYLKACVDGRIAGFVSITPPGRRYSVDKYFQRDAFPFTFDNRLYEVRLLTVLPAYRGSPIAVLLMYAALRWIEARGGSRIVAIGRREILSLYRKVGLQPLGRSTQSGAVTYDLLTGTVAELRQLAEHRQDTLRRLAGQTGGSACHFFQLARAITAEHFSKRSAKSSITSSVSKR